MQRLFSRCLACLCLLFGALMAHAQTARFTGQVTDQQNAAIPDAAVRIVNQDTGVKIDTKTDASGTYTVPFLAAGRYRIDVEAPGFKQAMSNNIDLGMGQVLIYNVQLSVGSAEATVNVSTDNEVTQVNTQNAEVSGTITGAEVTAIGLNGRNYNQLIALVPGVSNQTQQDEARVGALGSVSYSVNGGRTEYNSFQVDGSETMNSGMHKDNTSLIVTPSIDAIQEIKVLTSNYGAMYPSTGNGTTIVTTKSGTDQLHGNLYEFVRNEAFNAKGYFDVGNKAPMYRRNDFGGTIGGPVVIPHLYNGMGKTHFFFSEEARLETDPYAFRRAVPSLAERNGDFSDVCPYAPPGQSVVIDYTKNPDCPFDGALTGITTTDTVTYPGNKIPSVNPIATAMLNTGIFPAPNAVSGCNSTIGYCYNAEVALPTYYREELFRIDHAISDKMQASFRYIHDEWDTTTSTPQWGVVQNSFPTIHNRFYGPGLSLVGRITNTFSTTLLNEFVAGYTDSHITLADVAAPAVSLERPPLFNSSLGYLFNNGFGGKLPGIVIAGNNAEYGGNGFTVDPSYMPWSHTNPTYNVADNLTKILGKHELQFGLQVIYFQRNQTNGSIGAASGDVQGLITFSNIGGGSSSRNAFADFLTMSASGNDSDPFGGRIASYQQDSAQGRYYQRYRIAEPYFQDNWKVTPRLTLNLGVRLSLFGTYYEKGKNAYNWDPAAYSRALEETVRVDPYTGGMLDALTGKPVPFYEADGSVNPQVINGLVRCGRNGVPDGCMKGHLFNPAPRIGIAWDPMGNGKMAIRAGYGIFFEHGTPDEANTGSLEGSAPVVLSSTQLNPSGPDCIGNVGAGCPQAPGAFPINVTGIPTKVTWPYVQQWSLSIERELPAKMLASFAYVGSKGTHLTTEIQANQLLPVPAAIDPFASGEPLQTIDCRQIDNGEAGYNGNYYQLASGTKIWPASPGFTNMQAACYGVGGRVNPNALRQNYPGLGQIYSLENVANSSYNAFQTTLRRVQGPLNLGVAYTYSHSLDNASDRSDTTFVNSYDLRSNHANSNFDQRQLLHISYVYELPLQLKPSASLLGTLGRFVLGGWQLSGVTLFETGIPFSVVSASSPNGVGVNDNAGVANGVGISAYPDRIGDPHGRRPTVPPNNANFGPLLLNPGAFAAPRGLTFGNAGRNSLNNPSRWNFDTALLKHFKVKERATVEFRAEAFNVFNHTQFRIYDPTMGNQPNNTVSCYAPTAPYSAGDPGGGTDNGCLTGQSFLHPIDAHRPRTLQFGLKLAF